MKGFFCIEIKVLHQWGSEIRKFCLKDTKQYSQHKTKANQQYFLRRQETPKIASHREAARTTGGPDFVGVC